MACGAWWIAGGGQLQGGEADQGSMVLLEADGGQIQGGEADQGGENPFYASGGQTQGATVAQGGASPPCGTLPSIIGSRERAVRATNDEIGFAIGTAAGDTIVLAVWQEECPGAVGLPIGWTPLASGCDGANTTHLSTWYKVWDGTGSHGVSVTVPFGVRLKLATFTVRGAALPGAGIPGTGVANPVVAPSVNCGVCAALLVMFCGGPFVIDDFNLAPGMSAVNPPDTVFPIGISAQSPAGPGMSGTRTTNATFGDSWVSFLVSFPAA